MSDRISLTTADGHRFDAWRADPAGRAKGGVVVLHAIYGLTSHMGDVCDAYARDGYAAIAPALYDRIGKDIVHGYDPAGADVGRESYAALTKSQILADVAACADALRPVGPVAISGFCTGGTWAWIAAAELDFDAQVNYYGSHVASRLEYTPGCPTIAHYGDSDHIVPLSDIDRIRAAHPQVAIHVHPGGKHAFLNPDQASHDADIAAKAWRASIAFLDEQFGAR